jgi:hypothetical protein
MMVRIAIVAMAVMMGCVDAAPPDDPRPVVTIDKASVGVGTRAPDPAAPVDVCALAAQLEPSNVCSLMCEPDAMAAQLAANGLATGTCVEIYCALPDAQSVTVGVCLPPAQP